MADNDCVNRFSLGECDFGKPVTISVRSFLDFCGHRGQKFALSPLLSSKASAEWPVVCSGVHYYNIRSYLEYTNRLTALHWSRRKKGTEAHMSGIFQNIEPPPPPAKAPWLYLQAFSHSSWYYFALVTTNDNDGRANRRTDWTDYGSSFNLQFNFYLALCTALSPTASSLEAIEATGHSAVNHCACPIVINRYT